MRPFKLKSSRTNAVALIVLLSISGCQDVKVTLKESSDAKKQVEQVVQDSAKQEKPKTMSKSTSLKTSPNFNKLSKEEEYVIVNKGTERAFTGEYTDWKQKGTFICRRCNAPLYKTDSKFDSRCGWPSFDDQIGDSVDRHPDPDGYRVEIVCKNCGGHLGHVFEGEGFTQKDTRHCVNSLSIRFVSDGDKLPEVVQPQ